MDQSPFEPWTEGVFDIPNELYHDHQRAPEINRGLIVQMATRTPSHVKAWLDGRVVKKPTSAMITGNMMDLALLEPDKFREGLSHWVKPEGIDLRTKEGRQWKADHPGDLPVIPAVSMSATEASVEDINGMIAAVLRHRIARLIVERSRKQQSLFCYDRPTGLLRKIRMDAALLDNDGRPVIGDLKTRMLGGLTDDSLSKHCAQMGYHMQDVFYTDTYADLVGEEPYFLFVAVEKKPPYAVRVFRIHEEGRRVAREKYKMAMERFATCKAEGVWPSYREEIEELKLPQWELRIEPEE